MNPVFVVGVDDSTSARAALDMAANLARATGARLRVVHVLPMPTGTTPDWYPDVASPQATQVQKDAYGELFNELPPEPGWTMEFAEGDAGPALVALSRDADLLVVGARHLHGLARVFEGSVSQYVLRRADRPVLTVPSGTHLHPDEVPPLPHPRMSSSTEFPTEVGVSMMP